MLKEAKLDFVLMLPFRTFNRRSLSALSADGVPYLEGAWNAGSLPDVFLRYLTGNEAYPLWYDYMLFGSREAAVKRLGLLLNYFSGSLYVSHSSTSSHKIVELNPESARDWDGQVVVDFEHLFRAGRHGEDPLLRPDNWQPFFQQIRDANRLAAVHYKPLAKDLFDTPVADAAQMLRALQPDRIIIEAKPAFCSPQKLVERLHATAKWLRSVVN